MKLLFSIGKLNEPELIRYDILEAFIMTGKDNRSVNTIRGPSQIEITLLISQLVLSLAEIFFPQKITCLHAILNRPFIRKFMDFISIKSLHSSPSLYLGETP